MLQGIDYLLERNDPIMKSSPDIQPLSTIVGINHDFMYAIQLIDENFNIIKEEQGIARIVEDEHQTSGGIIAPAHRLKRTYSLTGKFANFYAPNSHLRIATCAPTSVMDFISPGEAVLVFRKDGHVDSVEMPEGSVLAREGGEIVPLSYKELMNCVPHVRTLALLLAMEDQLQLHTRRLDLTTSDATVSAPIFRLAPESYSNTSKPTPQQGMIIYNSDDRCLEFYDGKEWRALVWQ
jgi:hypothetical protein